LRRRAIVKPVVIAVTATHSQALPSSSRHEVGSAGVTSTE
jgi:hypothetical protein